jgi:hypothetical protein
VKDEEVGFGEGSIWAWQFCCRWAIFHFRFVASLVPFSVQGTAYIDQRFVFHGFSFFLFLFFFPIPCCYFAIS